MSEAQSASIYKRSIQLEVVIPEIFVWKFMKDFGEEFTSSGHCGDTSVKAVDGYHNHPNGWHVLLTISQHEKAKFNAFFKKFCTDNKIPFNDKKKNRKIKITDHIQHRALLVLFVPTDMVIAFISEYGTTFSSVGFEQKVEKERIDHFSVEPEGWNIQLILHEEDEPKFFEFLNQFCAHHMLTLTKENDS